MVHRPCRVQAPQRTKHLAFPGHRDTPPGSCWRRARRPRRGSEIATSASRAREILLDAIAPLRDADDHLPPYGRLRAVANRGVERRDQLLENPIRRLTPEETAREGCCR